MATYPIKLDLVNCTDNNSSKEYVNDGNTWAVFAAKAVDGCEFKEHDGENFYISRLFDGTTKKTTFSLSKVSSSLDQQVINGLKDGISSDGKYICRRVTVGSSNSGEMTCYINASIGTPPTPPTPTNLLRYDTTGLTGDVTITDKQGTDANHFDITVTGNGEGTFSNLTASYNNLIGDWHQEQFNVSGNVATLTVYCAENEVITITGSFISGVRELQITNNIQNTTANSVASETNYTVTVTGNANGMFNGTPTITYGNETYNMTVTNQTATAIVPIATESVIINGEYLLGEYIEVQYGLTKDRKSVV